MMPSTAEVQTTAWLPGTRELAQYEANGFLISPPIIPAKLLDITWAAIREFLSSNRSSVDSRARLSDLRRSAGAALDHVGYLYHELAEVRALFEQTPIAAIAARLSQSQSIRLFHDRLLVKPAGGVADAAIGWHVDRAYWFACTSDAMLTAWIPFVDVDEDMGALAVVAGSHRWEGGPLMATAHRTDMELLWTEATQRRNAKATLLAMKRGQVSFHHCRTVHGSMPNTGSVDRPALAVHFQPGDNSRRQVLLPNGRELGHANDLICRVDGFGQPDYSDPQAFPTLWPCAS